LLYSDEEIHDSREYPKLCLNYSLQVYCLKSTTIDRMQWISYHHFSGRKWHREVNTPIFKTTAQSF